MDKNEDKIAINMQLMMEQFQYEWEKGGCLCKRIVVTVKNLKYIYMIIVN
jgi:hypothetical protein